jgi:hypothetical protein
VGVRILVGVVAVLRATLVYGEVAAAESWEPRWPSWLRVRREPAEQPASHLVTAA